MLGALGRQSAQLLNLSCEAVACLLKAPKVQQTRAAAGLQRRGGRRDEREARGDDLRQLTLKACDLGLQRAPRGELRRRCRARVAEARTAHPLAGARAPAVTVDHLLIVLSHTLS